MKATYEIISERGLEGLVIQDITQAADVGYGSFYNHFLSKDAIVDAVIDAGREYSHEVYRRLRDLSADQLQIFAFELLACLRLSQSDKTWGWFVLRTVLSGVETRSGIAEDLRRALDACIESGHIASSSGMAYEITAGLLLIGTLKLLREEQTDGYPETLVFTILTHLGVPEARSRAILANPLPDLQLMPFLEAAA